MGKGGRVIIYEPVTVVRAAVGESAVSYGVRGRRLQDGKLMEEAFLPGIFTAAEDAAKFARLLEKKKICPCHMEDIAEDML